MNKLRLIALLDNLKSVVSDIEDEIKSNPDSYVMSDDNYDEVVRYYQNENDDDEEGLWWDKVRQENYLRKSWQAKTNDQCILQQNCYTWRNI